MFEPEQPPPKEGSSEKQQSWITRTWRRLANRWKWPGWGLLALLVLKDVPDWKGRLDFWLDAARTAGGYASVAAIVIGSPYFSIGLAIAGISWLALVGEPRKGVQRHHWLPYLGWIVFAICSTAIVLTAGWGAIQVYARNAVASAHSTEIDALQKQLATQSAQTQILQDQLRETEQRLGSTQRQIEALSHPPRDPQTLYQSGLAVGTIAQAQMDAARNNILFGVVTASNELDMSRPFEFRDWTLVCSGQASGSLSFGAMRQINYPNVVCRIQVAR
jgi:hypothetical protein